MLCRVDAVRALVAKGGFARRASLRDVSRHQLNRALANGRVIRTGRGADRVLWMGAPVDPESASVLESLL
jgi:hypothetical protein